MRTMPFRKRSRGGKSEFVSPSIADIRHYFCMRQSCNFHHRGDFMSPDTINAGCVRLCNGKLWKHSPLHGLCVSGAFCFVSISLGNHPCTCSSSSTVGGGGVLHKLVLQSNDPQSKRRRDRVDHREAAFCHIVARLAWIFLLQPRFPPSHKLCILELISSQCPQPDEYGSVPPGAARWRDAENTNIVLFFNFFLYV